MCETVCSCIVIYYYVIFYMNNYKPTFATPCRKPFLGCSYCHQLFVISSHYFSSQTPFLSQENYHPGQSVLKSYNPPVRVSAYGILYKVWWSFPHSPTYIWVSYNWQLVQPSYLFISLWGQSYHREYSDLLFTPLNPCSQKSESKPILHSRGDS